MAFSQSSEIITLLKKQLGLSEDSDLVLKVWDKEFAPMFSFAELVGLKDGHLVIEVLSSVHFQELALRRNEIASKINQYIGKDNVVKGIKIKLK